MHKLYSTKISIDKNRAHYAYCFVGWFDDLESFSKQQCICCSVLFPTVKGFFFLNDNAQKFSKLFTLVG